MTGAGRHGSWRERDERRRQVAREARLMPREPASWLPRVVLGVATLAWLAALGWLAATLPERVPTHWSGSGTPDGWTNRPFALGFALLAPLVFAYPLLWLSRLTMSWPEGINTPHKEWWLDTPARLVRFERLLREDLMLMAGLTVLLLTGIDLVIGYAAHQPGGQVPWWVFLLLVGGFLVGIGLVTARMLAGSRYRPREDDPDLR